VGRPAAPGNGVVQIAVFGGPVAAVEAARQVAGAYEAGQRCGGPVAGLGPQGGGVGHGARECTHAGQFRQQWGGDGGPAGDDRGPRARR
jgi:hypothetical protein